MFCRAAASLLALASLSACGQPPRPYLDQAPPGTVVQIFAPGVISLPDAYEYGSVFSRDGLEFYYGVNVEDRAEIRSSRWSGEEWTPAELAVGDELYTYGDPFLSANGQRLYFISNRPTVAGETEPKDFDIWFVERAADGLAWGEPVNLGPPVNSPFDEYYISFATSGRIYFASNRNAGERTRNFDVFSAAPNADGFDPPAPLQGEINTRFYEADAFVAPDESYIVVSSIRRGGRGQGDLYISRRRDDGSWGEALPLGNAINTDGHELCPFVTADGKYFFFTGNEELKWVDAGVLESFGRRN